MQSLYVIIARSAASLSAMTVARMQYCRAPTPRWCQIMYLNWGTAHPLKPQWACSAPMHVYTECTHVSMHNQHATAVTCIHVRMQNM